MKQHFGHKPEKSKMNQPFSIFYLTAQVRALLSQPVINGVRKPAPSILSQKSKKYEELFSRFPS
ncbi:hypothetical protein CUM97_07890 [Enterococcus mundtii]|uniref:Uncharacterized protein n=1 Tax=Enterococcus mundtii TaxID=53346 RepID=A0A2T5DFE6_ENTMU|nr:hypothetical protein CUM97_07890 [Enterococcus mundtii]PTO36695.1 hypothetical protein C6N14_02930 [Enterococcus mundtii]